VKSPPKHASPDYISLEARIIASADNRLYTWENPRNPNMRDELEMPFRIEALDLMNQNVENYLLMGKKGGISLSTLDGKQEEHFKCDPSESIRRMTQAEYDGKNYLIGGSHNTIYIYEPKKSNKPIEKIDNIPGLINNVSACGEWLAIAADRLYLHNLRNPSLSCEISSQELVDRDPSDAFISGRNVIVAAGSALLKYNIGNPLLCLDICNLEGTEINSITPTPHLGGTIFVATVDPQIYSVDSRTLDVNPKPFFKPGNNHNGTGRISYIEQAGFDYILATDKTNTMTPQNPGISLWNLCAPDVPRFFPIDCNHRIRGLVVIGSGDAK
jgi:hypothetical protein